MALPKWPLAIDVGEEHRRVGQHLDDVVFTRQDAVQHIRRDHTIPAPTSDGRESRFIVEKGEPITFLKCIIRLVRDPRPLCFDEALDAHLSGGLNMKSSSSTFKTRPLPKNPYSLLNSNWTKIDPPQSPMTPCDTGAASLSDHNRLVFYA